MKTLNQVFMELLTMSIEEPIKSGDIFLTKHIMNDTVLIIRSENKAVCFSIGWDPQEIHSVFSLN